MLCPMEWKTWTLLARTDDVTYQSWNRAAGKPSLGCMVTYRMPGVGLDAMLIEDSRKRLVPLLPRNEVYAL